MYPELYQYASIPIPAFPMLWPAFAMRCTVQAPVELLSIELHVSYLTFISLLKWAFFDLKLKVLNENAHVVKSYFGWQLCVFHESSLLSTCSCHFDASCVF